MTVPKPLSLSELTDLDTLVSDIGNPRLIELVDKLIQYQIHIAAEKMERDTSHFHMSCGNTCCALFMLLLMIASLLFLL